MRSRPCSAPLLIQRATADAVTRASQTRIRLPHQPRLASLVMLGAALACCGLAPVRRAGAEHRPAARSDDQQHARRGGGRRRPAQARNRHLQRVRVEGFSLRWGGGFLYDYSTYARTTPASRRWTSAARRPARLPRPAQGQAADPARHLHPRLHVRQGQGQLAVPPDRHHGRHPRSRTATSSSAGPRKASRPARSWSATRAGPTSARR